MAGETEAKSVSCACVKVVTQLSSRVIICVCARPVRELWEPKLPSVPFAELILRNWSLLRLRILRIIESSHSWKRLILYFFGGNLSKEL